MVGCAARRTRSLPTFAAHSNATAVPPLLSLMKQRVGASGTLNTGNTGAKPGAHASTWCGACPPPAAVPPATWDRLRAAAADWSRSHGSWTGNHSGFVRRAGARARRTREAIMQADIALLIRVQTPRQTCRPAALPARQRRRRLAAVDVRIRGLVHAGFGQLVRIFTGRAIDRHDRQRLHGDPGSAARRAEFCGESSLQFARTMPRLSGYSP